MRRPRGPQRSSARGVLAAACIVLAISALSACTSSPAPKVRPDQRDPRPNIVFVLTDDLSTDLVQYMPHVQAMEQAGTSFSHYFVVDSLCCPSRSAILTGQYPHNNGVFTNHGQTDGGYHTFNNRGDDKHTFALALQKAGYDTGFMGKYLNEYYPVDHKPVGWNDWVATGNGYPEYNYVLNDNGQLRHYGHQPKDYLTDVLAGKADDFIDNAAHHTKPFALEVATFAPHKPAIAAPRDHNSFPSVSAPQGPAFDRAPLNGPSWLAGFPPLTPDQLTLIEKQYRHRVEAVQAVDRLIGRLEEKLAAEGLLRNTYFVFSSDNGYHMGQYRLLPGKQTAYDTDIRVPLVVTGPHVPAGATVDAMTTSIDLAPTFSALGGGKLADNPDGTNLLPLWHGDPVPANWQQAVLIEHHGPDTSPHDPDAQKIREGNPPSYEAVRTNDAVYVEYRTGEREYYDLTTDPNELDNTFASEPPSRIAEMQNTLHQLEECHGAVACQAAAQFG